MLGITLKTKIGLGDGLQFSSLPENYHRTTGQKLLDISKPWFFDHNPFVVRDENETPDKTIELWNFPRIRQWPILRPHKVYLSNAEIHAAMLNVRTFLNRPRLYKFEDVSFRDRKKIILHTDGKSNGRMPEKVIKHILDKYESTGYLMQIGPPTSAVLPGVQRIETPTYWDLAEMISDARLFIGVDSGPSWIASCFPDILVKVIRLKPTPMERYEKWVPLEVDNVHSHWDDRCRQMFNTTEDDIGFTYSYRKL